MAERLDKDALQVARRWCERTGPGWSIVSATPLGEGGTAPVFETLGPEGERALKIYDSNFSAGERGEIERKRIEAQLSLKGHTCPFLVQIYDGGMFEGRLYLLMNRAAGRELEKRLAEVPRKDIRRIVGQIAQAAIFLRDRNLCHRDIKSSNIFVSNNFEHSTLLDISVIRNIYDPIGSGTDHDGNLPIVATARYSPPEYLFRLANPSQELWHALTVYQLGGLLHDLIMRRPLFEEEYQQSSSNRYRFAWIVATEIPRIDADDVDQGLVLLARRALDKDWVRRSRVKLEDFLDSPNTQGAQALSAIGFTQQHSNREGELFAKITRAREAAARLERAVLARLKEGGITAVHLVKPGSDDLTKILTFGWNASATTEESAVQDVELRLTLKLLSPPSGLCFGMTVLLTMLVGGAERSASIDLPDMGDQADVENALAREIDPVLEQLAVRILKGNTEGREA